MPLLCSFVHLYYLVDFRFDEMRVGAIFLKVQFHVEASGDVKSGYESRSRHFNFRVTPLIHCTNGKLSSALLKTRLSHGRSPFHILRYPYTTTMKLSFAAFSLACLSSASAFSPASNGVSKTFALTAATIESPPTREAPGAGWEPDWEDRPGLSPDEFMKSDMSKPDLSGMWECPLTRWDSAG